MRRKISITLSKNNQKSTSDCRMLDMHAAEKSMQFHKSFPEYQPTPLVVLENLSESLGVGAIFVKDESYRFGLNAFKVLGGSFAIGRYLANVLSMSVDDVDYNAMISEDARKKLKDLTLISATDGNHGRGVAWTANRLGVQAIPICQKKEFL